MTSNILYQISLVQVQNNIHQTNEIQTQINQDWARHVLQTLYLQSNNSKTHTERVSQITIPYSCHRNSLTYSGANFTTACHKAFIYAL